VRRISFWILSTVSVTVLLFGFDASQRGSSIGGTAAAFSGGTSGTSSGAQDSSGSRNGTSGSSSSGNSGSGNTSPGTSPKTQGSQPKTTTSTVTGATAQTRWGPVQIRLTIAAGKITKVAILQYPNGNSLDLQIANYAFPRLIQQTISSQGAQVDMISGATYTSTGYLQSLQSALDQANL
jgi:uncharacterized protein with FMN-binding domain